MPRSFTPNRSKFAGQVCHGFSVSITDRSQLDPLRLGFELAIALRDEFPQLWDDANFNRLLGNREIYQAFQQGANREQLEQQARTGLDSFQKRRERYLIYD